MKKLIAIPFLFVLVATSNCMCDPSVQIHPDATQKQQVGGDKGAKAKTPCKTLSNCKRGSQCIEGFCMEETRVECWFESMCITKENNYSSSCSYGKCQDKPYKIKITSCNNDSSCGEYGKCINGSCVVAGITCKNNGCGYCDFPKEDEKRNIFSYYPPSNYFFFQGPKFLIYRILAIWKDRDGSYKIHTFHMQLKSDQPLYVPEWVTGFRIIDAESEEEIKLKKGWGLSGLTYKKIAEKGEWIVRTLSCPSP